VSEKEKPWGRSGYVKILPDPNRAREQGPREERMQVQDALNALMQAMVEGKCKRILLEVKDGMPGWSVSMVRDRDRMDVRDFYTRELPEPRW
jgi:hypothetical protein